MNNPDFRPPQVPPTLSGHIKRRLLQGLALVMVCAALFGIMFMLALQLSSGQSMFTRGGLILGIVAVFFVVGVVFSGWFIDREVIRPLNALAQLEGAIHESAHSERAKPMPENLTAEARPGTLFRDYGLLIGRLRDKDTLRLEFLGSLVHELRSPLASIVGYASMLADPAHLRGPDEAEKYVGVISAQAQRMGDLIDDVLIAAQAQFDRLEIVATPMRLDTLVADIASEIAEQSRRPIMVSGDAVPIRVKGDALRLRQVFVNLIENAVKFSPADTPVSVALRCADAGWRVEATVTDQGIGLMENEIPKLFRPFGRIKNAQTRGIAGSGLGLYIVSHIVERHGGTVLVNSKPGEGSVFTVMLPLDEGTSL